MTRREEGDRGKSPIMRRINERKLHTKVQQ